MISSAAVAAQKIRHHLSRSAIVRDTSWMFFGQGGRLVIQAAYFVLLGRSLGVSSFGAFVSTVALVSILIPFADMGSGKLLIMHVARNRNFFPVFWGNALVTSVTSGTCCLAIALLVNQTLLPQLSLSTTLSVGIAELYFGSLSSICSQAFQAVDRVNVAVRITLLTGLSRLVAVIPVALVVARPTQQLWGVGYLSASVVAAGISWHWVTKEIGKPAPNVSLIPGCLREGWYFSLGLSSQSIYNDIDKTMLAQLDTLAASGIYAAAYRVVLISFTPVRSLLYASAARFFQAGAKGIEGSLIYGRRLLPFAVSYGLLASVGLFLFAPIVPIVLGRDYQDSVAAVRWLALLPLFQSIHFIASDVLGTSGLQRARSITQGGIAIFNIAMNLVLIPLYSWRGAAVASLLTDGSLGVLLWAFVWFYVNSSRKARKGAPE